MRYQFTDEELSQINKDLAKENKNLESLENDKKAIVSEFGSKINYSKAIISRLSNNISNGYDYRDIECEIRLHFPEVGRKAIIRLDTGEIVRIDEMSKKEMQEEMKFSETKN